MKWIVKAFELKGIADVLKDVITQCWFVFTPSSIQLLNVDPERVIAVLMELRPPSDLYFCEHRLEFSIYVQTLYKVLRGVKTQENAEVTLEPGAEDLFIRILRAPRYVNAQISIRCLQDKMPCYDTKRFTMEVLRQNKICVILKTTVLYRVLHDLAAISRRATFHVQGNTLTIKTQDNMGTASQFQTQVNDGSDVSFDVTILGKYIEKFTKPNLCLTCDLLLGEGEATVVVYHLSHGYLALSIAPMV